MMHTVLPEPEWLPLAHTHHARMDTYVVPHLERRARGESHAVMDFLFEYYPYSPSKLRSWHPGVGIGLSGRVWEEHKRSPYEESDGAWVAGMDPRVNERLTLTLRLLEGTYSRPAQVHCFGLHEWAMVYRTDEIRHSSVPLRVSSHTLTTTVEDIGLRCTHIDAFRFFTDAAVPMNAFTPTRDSQPELEQPGCIHATMDLYKYAMWFQPWVGSTLVADCFELAVESRTLDMAASPYDVSAFGLEPVLIETPEGRLDYATRQRALTDKAQPLRLRLIKSLAELRAALQHEVPVEVG